MTLDGSGSDGGPWGTNVSYSWELTTPVSGVTFDDDTSATPEVTIPELEAGTKLTFTLTVTGARRHRRHRNRHGHRQRDGDRLHRVHRLRRGDARIAEGEGAVQQGAGDEDFD